MDVPFASEAELGVIALPPEDAPVPDQLGTLERAVSVGPLGWNDELAAGRSDAEINEVQRAVNSSAWFTLVETRRHVVRTLARRVAPHEAAATLLARIVRDRPQDVLGFEVAEAAIDARRPRQVLEIVAGWTERPSRFAHWHWQLGARATLRVHAPADAFTRLAPTLDDPELERRTIEAVTLFDGEIDPRWFTAMARFLSPEAGRGDSGRFFWRHIANAHALDIVTAEARRMAETGAFNGYFYNTLDRMKSPALAPALLALVKAAAPHGDWRLTRPLGILAELADVTTLDELRALAPAMKGKAKTALATVIGQLETKLGVPPLGKPKKPAAPRSPLARQLVEAGLSVERANSIDKLARARIDLAPSPAGEMRVGQTRFGGTPDLPRGVTWPHVTCSAEQMTLAPAEHPAGTLPPPDAKGRYRVPLGFVAQLDLSELAPHDVDRLLPSAGTLWFFARQEIVVGEKRELQQIASAVLHAPAGTELVPSAFPDALPAFERHPAAAIAVGHCVPVPPPTVEPVQKLAFVASEHEAFERARARNPVSTDHACLGWAEDAAYYRGIPATKEQLLLRCGSEAISGFEWGDSASIFFVIPTAALASLEFGKAYCLMDE